MGSCSLAMRKSRLLITLQDSCAYFLNHQTNCVYKYTDAGLSSQFKLIGEQVPRHSAYTYQFPFLFVIGGSDSENPLRNEALKLDLSSLTIEYLPTLPIGSKHGDVYIQNEHIYYIGAVHLQNYAAMPTPFLRLGQNGSSWEILGENVRPRKNVNISNCLLRPGTCKHGSSLYIVGGEIIKGKNEKIFNSSVFCMDLNTLIVNMLGFEGVSIGSPKCIYLSSGILVFGGYNDDGFNREMWILAEKRMKINENCMKVSGNKVMHKVNNHYLTFGTKKMKKLSEEKLTWKAETLDFEADFVNFEIEKAVNEKKLPEAPSRVIIFPMYMDEDKSNFGSLRMDSRKHSPSNFFNSQIDFEFSQTFQQGGNRELSDINSIIEYSEFK